MSVSATALIDEAEAKKCPEIPSTIDNDYLVSLIEAATQLVEAVLGKAVIQRSFVEQHSGGPSGAKGGAKRLFLENYPIQSVTSIEDDGGDTVEAGDFTIIKDEGVLEHDRLWPAPVDGYWKVTYVAGLAADRASAPWRFKEACRRLLVWLYRQPNPALVMERLGETTLQWRQGGEAEGLVPPDVWLLLASDRSVHV